MIRFTGDMASMSAADIAQIMERNSVAGTPDLENAVRSIIRDVRDNGDSALLAMAKRYDNVSLTQLEVPGSELQNALDNIDATLRGALEEAARAIRAFHEAQRPRDIEMSPSPGVRLGRRSEPLERVGVYAPGGRAAYPSSILMGVIPARVAGVAEVIVCTPPGSDGLPNVAVLAACAIAGADRVFAIGGAGAIAALAFGTETVPRVARIVGPGNAYVAEAKRQVNGVVSIDSPAGPSEVLVIADETAPPELVAAEMIAQAEHDPDAASVAIVVGGQSIADRVIAEIARLTVSQPRADIIRESLAANGAVIRATSLETAIAFSNTYAPEHLSLMIRDPNAALPLVRCAGTVFLGASTSVAFGDYITGANHVLPTGQAARSFSGLSTLDFMRQVTYQEVTRDAARRLAVPTRVLAMSEGLPAHALAAQLRASPIADEYATSGAPRSAAPSQQRGVSSQERGVSSQRRAPSFARAGYRDIELYEPGRLPCAVDLSDNTNLHGVPPSARKVLESDRYELVTRYPTVYSRDLKGTIAAHLDVAYENVLTGCGSDDILDSAVRAFCEPGDAVVFPTPTFGVVDLFARMNVARSVAVAHRPGFELDVNALADARGAVTYICNPNNPTGTMYSRESIEELARVVNGVLIIDEAYASYADSDCIDLALSSDRVLIVRTMSKAYGLAGLRVGYAIGSPALVREVEKSRGPYKVGGLAEAAAIAAIVLDGEWVAGHVAVVVRNRARLAGVLYDMGMDALPSASNFLLVPVAAGADAVEIGSALRERGVAVRAFRGLPGVGDAIRVTIGPWEMMEQFVTALAAVTADSRLTGTPS